MPSSDGKEIRYKGASFFGYDRLVKHDDFLELKGDDVPTLHTGMTVRLRGDSRGYVPGGFEPDEEVQITAFRMPSEDGWTDDHLIQVSNGSRAGWLKPSNVVPPARQEPEVEDAIESDSDLSAMGHVPEAGPADPEHFAILKQGAVQWNPWRLANPEVIPRLAGCDLRGLDLREINFRSADLSSIEGYGIDLYRSDLRRANLRRAFLQSARLVHTDLRGADLSGASFSNAILISANLRRATLTGATCMWCDFSAADLSGADLTEANLRYGQLFDAKLREATLVGTDLMAALLIRVDLRAATLDGCRVHGVAVWKTKSDQRTKQANLIVTDYSDPTVTADSLELAQFIHLLIDTAVFRQVIDSMTGKAVLLLGRFTPPRMKVLSAMADRLRELGDLPIIFNFDKPVDRSITETVRILAGLSKYVMADLTDPGSVGYESHLTVPDLVIPFVPIIEKGQREFAMFDDLYDYDWLLEGFQYRDASHLCDNLPKLRQEALSKREDIRERRSKRGRGFREALSKIRN
jgi:uncharacterized protein YjbI with pentapeptide repeats